MKLRTLLTFCFLTVILLLGLGVGILNEVGMERLARANLQLADQSVREISELTGGLARREMVRLLENSLRRHVSSAGRQLSVLLAGRDTTQAQELRRNAELVSLVRQEIRNTEGQLCGGFMLFDAQLKLVLAGFPPGWADAVESAPSEQLRLLAEAQAGLENGTVTEYITVNRNGQGPQNLLVVASNVSGTGLVLAAEVDTRCYVGPMQQSIRDFQDNTFRSIQTQVRQQAELSQWQLRIFLVGGLGALVLVTVFFMFRFVSAVVRPLMRVQAAVAEVGKGRFEVKVPITGTAEVQALARTVNQLGKSLQRYMENLSEEIAAREAVEAELHAAGAIQQSMLPKDQPPFLDALPLELFAENQATAQVGGDLYDYFPLADGRIAVLIGDVSGKGMTAALFMSMARMVLRISCARAQTPGQALAEANRILCKDNETSLFVTLFLLYYDPAEGRGTFANAGHTAPLLLRGRGESAWLDEPHGTVLGAVAEARFPSASIGLESDDVLLLFTDGVLEARRGKEFFGAQRLEQALIEIRGQSARKICEHLVAAVREFQADRMYDDVTLLVLKRTAGEPE